MDYNHGILFPGNALGEAYCLVFAVKSFRDSLISRSFDSPLAVFRNDMLVFFRTHPTADSIRDIDN